MVNLRLYGIYENPAIAIRKVEELSEHDYKRENIKVISSRIIHEPVDGAETYRFQDVDPTDDMDDYKENGVYLQIFSRERIQQEYKDSMSFWEKIKSMLSFKYLSEDEMKELRPYQDELDKRHVLVFVDDEDIPVENRLIDKSADNLNR